MEITTKVFLMKNLNHMEKGFGNRVMWALLKVYFKMDSLSREMLFILMDPNLLEPCKMAKSMEKIVNSNLLMVINLLENSQMTISKKELLKLRMG